MGFLGPGPVEAHLRHAEGFGLVVEATGPVPSSAVDLGSGGGVPGLALAQRWPATSWVLVEANGRRAAFLARACRALGAADRVTVLETRAEAVGRGDRRGSAGLVTARGFGRPAVVAECAAPLLAGGGRLVVSEPPDVDPPRWPDTGTAKLGLSPAESHVAAGARFVVLRQVRSCPRTYPRRVGVPARRPLF